MVTNMISELKSVSRLKILPETGPLICQLRIIVVITPSLKTQHTKIVPGKLRD